MAFPENTQQHLYMDGAAETLLGLGLAVPKTRKLAVIGLLGYGSYSGRERSQEPSSVSSISRRTHACECAQSP